MAGAKSYMTFGPVHQQVERDEQREQHPLLRLVRDSGPPTARHPRRIRVERHLLEPDAVVHGQVHRGRAGAGGEQGRGRPPPAETKAGPPNGRRSAVPAQGAGPSPSRGNNTQRDPSLAPTPRAKIKISFWMGGVGPPMAYACR